MSKEELELHKCGDGAINANGKVFGYTIGKDYTYEPNTEIGIILAKEDIDRNRKTPLTDKQWETCVGLINRGKIDLGCVYDVLEEYCQSIVEEYCETE
jgi:hypothetical protein|tara:strand:+ start:1832 stop:2125 length:294 start_codon:yes stop_codon:yes gene_type:complete